MNVGVGNLSRYGDGDFMFTKSALDDWLESNAAQPVIVSLQPLEANFFSDIDR